MAFSTLKEKALWISVCVWVYLSIFQRSEVKYEMYWLSISMNDCACRLNISSYEQLKNKIQQPKLI